MHDASLMKRPVNKLDFGRDGRDDLVQDGFGGSSPVTTQITQIHPNPFELPKSTSPNHLCHVYSIQNPIL